MTYKKKDIVYYLFPLFLNSAEELNLIRKKYQIENDAKIVIFNFALKYHQQWKNLKKLLKMFNDKELTITDIEINRVILNGDSNILDDAYQKELIKKEIIDILSFEEDYDDDYDEDYDDDYDDEYNDHYEDDYNDDYYRNNYKNNEIIKQYDILNTSIRLKLEGTETNVYILNQGREIFVRQCKFLMLNPPYDGPEQGDTTSIDGAAEHLDRSMEHDPLIRKQLTPEEEFWGHCSNLEMWSKEDYDARFLHSSIAMPLLKELVKAGDEKANRVFSSEIIKMFETGIQNTTIFLIDNDYLDFLNEIEINQLLNSSRVIETMFKSLREGGKAIKLSAVKYFKKCGEKGLRFLSENIDYVVSSKNEVLEIIEHFSKFYHKERLVKFFDKIKDLLFKVVLQELIDEEKKKIKWKAKSKNLRIEHTALLKKIELVQKKEQIERIKREKLSIRLDRLNILEDIIK